MVEIFKAGDKTSIKNYQPISLLSYTSKILERLVFNKIINHLATQISPSQFGFIKGTLQRLLVFFDFLPNSSTQVDTIYLDIYIRHSILCPTVHKYRGMVVLNIQGVVACQWW